MHRPLTDDDRAILALARSIRADSPVEYARFLRLAAKSAKAAAIVGAGHGPRFVDASAQSTDGFLS